MDRYYVFSLAELPEPVDAASVKEAIAAEAARSGLGGGTVVVIPAGQAQAVSFAVTQPPPQVQITKTSLAEDAR
jgi:galactokinase